MRLTLQDYQRLESEFVDVLTTFEPKLSPDSRSNIRPYVDHGELEMAFELLGLDLIEGKIPTSDATRTSLWNLGMPLGLDKESVYDVDFWRKFSHYTGSE
jgi:hypothetical protein